MNDPHHTDDQVDNPPVARYRFTLTITGNTLDEIERELLAMTRGGFLLDSDYGTRDEWKSYSGTRTSVMEHANPSMTAEQYDRDLHTWHERRIAARREADQ